MVDINKVMIGGRVTRKPVLRRTLQGIPVTDLFIAINREFTKATGEREKEVCFVDVVVWGKQAENCVQFLDVSSSVVVEGRLHFDTWVGKEGDKRSKLQIAADSVHFMDKNNKPKQLPINASESEEPVLA